jgi:hypothetical protein
VVGTPTTVATCSRSSLCHLLLEGRAAASFSLSSVVHAIASSSFLHFSASFKRVGILGVNEGGKRLVTVAVRAMGRR